MAQFRKKPIVIDALQVSVALIESPLRAPQWLIDGYAKGIVRFYTLWNTQYIDIQTLEGTMRAVPGDWVIRGIKGELYPCKDDIFRATYEPAEMPLSDAAVQSVEEQARAAAVEAWKTGRPVMGEREQDHPEWFKDRFDQWADYQARLRADAYVTEMRRAFSEAFYGWVVTRAIEEDAFTAAGVSA